MRRNSIGVRITPAIPAGLTYTTSDRREFAATRNFRSVARVNRTEWPARVGVPQIMEVILTLPNRITLAGVLPILVAFALAVLVAAIALAPSKPASAAFQDETCNLSPVILDMLLDRYGLDAQDCDELNYGGADAFEGDDPLEADADTWDFSNQELTAFAISDDDATLLRVLSETAVDTPGISITESFVRYIDLTNNPLTVDDVSFENIPFSVAVVLSAESNVAGFQSTEYELTEGQVGYISAAFPDIRDVDTADMAVTVTVGGDAGEDINPALLIASGAKIQLVSFGTTGTGPDRTFLANSDDDDTIFYWPIKVDNDNGTDDDWEIALSIDETVAATVGADGITNADANFRLVNDEADVTILDADAPALSVCDRSEDVEAAIRASAEDDAVGGQTGPGGFGENERCSDITLRDLGTLRTLTIADADDNDREAIESLIAGDFEGMTELTSLKIVGARTLPSGIFDGVGKDADPSVHIYFAENNPEDEDADKVGKFTPSTIPSHIWADQEAKQVIVLDDDKNEDDEGVTNGLDADLYAVTEGEHFFVLTSALTAAYILGDQVAFVAAGDNDATEVKHITITDDGRGDEVNPKVVRFAVEVADDPDKGDRNAWLFLFGDADGTDTGNPTNASGLEDIAVVAITDAA